MNEESIEGELFEKRHLSEFFSLLKLNVLRKKKVESDVEKAEGAKFLSII